MKNETILKCCFALGALFAASGVIFQALASHLPSSFLTNQDGRTLLHTAANMALWHGIALCSLSICSGFLHPVRKTISCCLMVLGTIFFSVSIILLSFKVISHATLAPFGGSMLILAWLIMASAVFGPKMRF
ncbi:DUF423 domain-containing protein [Aristophania vespae]|uniref:DUF423 domain-containing protein n=1 Tax=Aristophania vespae TaxID=2697033 RepID=A0A6P1NEC9_9PROT|nr:DUF423 domain-containing protein [Aristophania vespae]QHI95773.1 DUF423 domain-containing protein [Aristophania vespae]